MKSHVTLRELRVVYSSKRKRQSRDGETLRSAANITRLYRDHALSPKEQLAVLYCDGRNRQIDRQIVSIGTTTTSLAHPREIFQAALLLNAGAIILVHNHPSGDPAPSPEDDALTERIVQCGNLLGIKVLDHVILCPNIGRYHSYQEAGRLDTED